MMTRPVIEHIKSTLGEYVYGIDVECIEEALIKLLEERKLSFSAAESCTGGRMAAGLIDNPGSSAVLTESFITYADEAKMRILGVRPATIQRFSAVSEQCAREMAEGARKVSGATWGVSSTGYAGPDGGSAGDPVGTVYIAVAGPEKTVAKRFFFNGNREWVRTLACTSGWNLLRMALSGTEEP